MHALDSDFVEKYARIPETPTINRAIKLHEEVRSLLGDQEYATLLQGSYKNSTYLHDMNDVDIVAVSKSLTSRQFGSVGSGRGSVTWDEIFGRIENKLNGHRDFKNRWIRDDKCIKIKMDVNIDVVPAVKIHSPTDDPISIYSFKERSERQNWPRSHYSNGARKSEETNGNFKQNVRLFKQWAKANFGDRKVAPSYYIECLLYHLPSHVFTGTLATDFVNLSEEIIRRFGGHYHTPHLGRVAGDGNILQESEWSHRQFDEFIRTIRTSLAYAKQALACQSPSAARDYWIRAFDGYTGMG